MATKYYIENTEEFADKLFHCHEQVLEPHKGISPHVHNWVELLYCTKGENQVLLGNALLPFEEGSLIVIPVNEVHRIESLSEGESRYIVVKFPTEVILNLVDETDYDIIRPFMLMSAPKDYLFTAAKLQSLPIIELCEEILKEYDEKEYGYRIAIRTAIYQIVKFLVRSWHNSYTDVAEKMTPASAHSKRIYECLSYIQKNYTQPITLDLLAKRCHVSYCYFSRQFSEVTGTSFAGYLSNVRVSAAEHLLITTDTPITEIAFQVGFSDASYFTRRFVLKNGVTPNTYRQRFSVLLNDK